MVVRGVGYQLQLPTAVRSSRRVNVILFVFVFGCTIRSNTNRLFVSLFGTEANTKRIFGTALLTSSIVLRCAIKKFMLQNMFTVEQTIMADSHQKANECPTKVKHHAIIV